MASIDTDELIAIRGSLITQLHATKAEHDHAEERMRRLARECDQLHGAIDVLNTILQNAERTTPARVADPPSTWPDWGSYAAEVTGRNKLSAADGVHPMIDRDLHP